MIGGDGSLTGANLFREEWSGLLEELAQKGKFGFRPSRLLVQSPEWLYTLTIRLQTIFGGYLLTLKIKYMHSGKLCISS